MKNLLTILSLIVLPACIYAQDKDSLQLQQLKSPPSPGFSLLDVSPTSIESPTSPKMLAIQTVNVMRSGIGIPKNFALEFSPYWILKPKNETILKYMGLPDKESSNIAAGLLRKLSLSFVTYFNDSAKNFLPNTNYASLGIRTNIVTIWGGAKKDMMDLLATRNQVRQFVMRTYPGTDANTKRKLTDSIYEEKQASRADIFMMKPAFVLDGAFASSASFRDNNYKNKRFNRSGFWLNATLNTPSNKLKNDNLFVIFYYRNMRDNILKDTAANLFSIRNSNDLGLRAGYAKGQFSLSFEHISRQYSNIKNLNSTRTIGILQFKVNDALYLTGTFGKNFSARENLFTALGLSWGLGKQSLALQ